MTLIVTVLPSFDVSYGNALMALIVTVLPSFDVVMEML